MPQAFLDLSCPHAVASGRRRPFKFQFTPVKWNLGFRFLSHTSYSSSAQPPREPCLPFWIEGPRHFQRHRELCPRELLWRIQTSGPGSPGIMVSLLSLCGKSWDLLSLRQFVCQ